MRLSAFTDYGLRMLMRLADAPERSFTTAAIAEEFGIPYNHLAKVVQDLARGGFVVTRRGAGGGVRLARAADGIGLGEVVRCLEQRHAITECFRADGGNCVLTANCQLRPQLLLAQEAFFDTLDQTSLAQCRQPASADGSPPAH